jgi:hypothetical protein
MAERGGPWQLHKAPLVPGNDCGASMLSSQHAGGKRVSEMRTHAISKV